MTSSATFTMCLSQFELVYCSVSLHQERWRLFYGCADDCLAFCTVSNVPWFATQPPEQNTLSKDSWWLPMLFTLRHLLPQYHCHKAWVFWLDGARKSLFAFNVSFVSVCLWSHNFSHSGAFQRVWCRKQLLCLQQMLPKLQCHDQQTNKKKKAEEPRYEQKIHDEGKHPSKRSSITKLTLY